jgi:hypothetical protein
MVTMAKITIKQNSQSRLLKMENGESEPLPGKLTLILAQVLPMEVCVNE